MERLVGFPPHLPRRFSLAVIALFFGLFLGAADASAEAIWLFTRPSDPPLPNPPIYGPAGINRLIDNWRNTFFNDVCTGGKGIVFDVAVDGYQAVKINGISVMVWSLERPLGDADFASLRLTVLPGRAEGWLGQDLSEKVLKESLVPVTDPAVFPGYKKDIGSYHFSYEVLFKFPPILLKGSETTLTAILECKADRNLVVWGSKDLYPLGKSFVFKDGSKIERYPSNFSNFGVQHSLYVDPTLLYHPVILVHDLGGRPQDFLDNKYPDLLSGESFKPEFVKIFDFGSEGENYKSFSDLRPLSQYLAGDIKTLSNAYKKAGGDGKVDVVAFGAGSLIVKDFLSKNKNQSNIRNFISVGAPNKGSWLLDLENGITPADVETSKLNPKIAGLFIPSLKKLNVLTYGRAPTASSVLDQVRSDSDTVKELGDEAKFPASKEVKYSNLMGNIKVRTRQAVFHGKVDNLSSLGDGAVTSESARLMCASGDAACNFVFSQEVSFPQSLVRGTPFSVGYSWNVPDLVSLNPKFMHHNLLGSDEIKAKIKELLSSL